MMLFAAASGVTSGELLSGLIGSLLGAFVGSFIAVAMAERREHRNQVKDVCISVLRNTRQTMRSVHEFRALSDAVKNHTVAEGDDDSVTAKIERVGGQLMDAFDALTDDMFALEMVLGTDAAGVIRQIQALSQVYENDLAGNGDVIVMLANNVHNEVRR